MLPYTAEVLFSLFGRYNEAIWPAQIVAYLLGALIILLLLRPQAWSGRLISAILALAWIWNGAAYHLTHFASINFLAPLFGIAFLIEGALFIWSGVIRSRLTFPLRRDAPGWAGIALIVFAMILYPTLAWAAGHVWPATPAFGVAPCPMTIFTFGVLLTTAPRVPWHLLVIPVFWALVGGSAAWLLAIPEDLSLPLAALLTVVMAAIKNRQA